MSLTLLAIIWGTLPDMNTASITWTDLKNRPKKTTKSGQEVYRLSNVKAGEGHYQFIKPEAELLLAMYNGKLHEELSYNARNANYFDSLRSLKLASPSLYQYRDSAEPMHWRVTPLGMECLIKLGALQCEYCGQVLFEEPCNYCGGG